MRNRCNPKKAVWWLSGIMVVMSWCGATLADALDSAMQTEQGSNQSSRTSQQRIDAVSEETDELLLQYRRVVRETESLRIYNAALEKMVENQRAEISTINRQLGELESTNRGVVPLLIEMIDMLDQIVENDMPFRVEERRNVVLDLRDAIYRADVTASEKYRRVMEAYQREIDFGRAASSYEGRLPDQPDKTVTFLKVGRTLLIYQTLDGETVGWWNPNSREWEELGQEYRTSVTRAIRMAKNQEPSNLIKLPVPAAQSEIGG